ncbi:MAG: DUF4421 domain-containing protein [Ginsengibacter sp.]
MKKYYFCIFALAISTALLPYKSSGQKKFQVNTNYFVTYPEKLMLRLFLSQKFAPFTIGSQSSPELNYKTNSKLSLGAGFTYKVATLNLSYGFSFLNKDKGLGKTKGLDLQLHLYPHQWAIDILGTFRTGYYLDPGNHSGFNFTNYYNRPDIKRKIEGLSVFRVPNAEKFSYRAALNQNDVQIKSAGSLLFGAEAYHGSIAGDSALVPTSASSIYKQAGVEEITFISVGPGIGYAYTLVMAKNFFISASAIGSLHVNFSTEEKDGTKLKKTSILPGGIYKAAIGYNTSSWSISANLLGNVLYAGSETSSQKYFVPTGNARFTIAKKISTRKH